MAEKSLAARQTPNLPVPMKDIIRRRELILDILKIEQSRRLFRAITNDDYEGAKTCLEAGADPNARDEHGAPPLARAVQKTLPDLCALLVRYGADANINIEDGITPLMTASMSVNTLVVKCLIGCGADKDAMCDVGKTPLIFALQNTCMDNVRALLEAGADPNMHGEGVDHPLIWAIHHYADNESMSMVEMLISHGADCSEKSLGISVFDAFCMARLPGTGRACAMINLLNAFLQKKEVRNVLNDAIMRPFIKQFLGCIASSIRTYLR